MRVAGRLRVVVADTGPGPRGGAETRLSDEIPAGRHTVSTGVGLPNIRDRLAQAYGEDHRFQIDNPPEGGFTVTIEIPYELYHDPEAARTALEKPTAPISVTSTPGQRALGTNA